MIGKKDEWKPKLRAILVDSLVDGEENEELVKQLMNRVTSVREQDGTWFVDINIKNLDVCLGENIVWFHSLSSGDTIVDICKDEIWVNLEQRR